MYSMEYLPTFTPKMAQTWVNIPYMEHLGTNRNLRDIYGVNPQAPPGFFTAPSKVSGQHWGRRHLLAPVANHQVEEGNPTNFPWPFSIAILDYQRVIIHGL